MRSQKTKFALNKCVLPVLWANTATGPQHFAHYSRCMKNVLFSISIAGDALVKDGTKCDTCRSTECVSHWRAGIVALIPLSVLMSNIKFETLMQHWGNAVQRCRMIISDAPAWSGTMLSREDIAVRPPDGSEVARISKNSRGAREQGGVWLQQHLYG